jgi:hypothetical protein
MQPYLACSVESSPAAAYQAAAAVVNLITRKTNRTCLERRGVKDDNEDEDEDEESERLTGEILKFDSTCTDQQI